MLSGKRARIAIFASGTGSNALKIIQHFTSHPYIRVRAVVCNNPEAGVIRYAKDYDIPTLQINSKSLSDPKWFLRELQALGVDYIVLAGFLLLIPEYVIDKFPGKIINIHPALLPKYGGKGMYGMHVHEAVKKAGEKETGITIHHVNKNYDDGEIVFQKSIPIDPKDTPEMIAQKVHALEHAYYPDVIERWIESDIQALAKSGSK